MGLDHASRRRADGGGPAGDAGAGAGLNDELDGVFRAHWWSAVAIVTRLVGGDLEIAEDAVQDACAAALRQWPADGVPSNPRAWLVTVARHKALDRIRRESVRAAKEAAAMADPVGPGGGVGPGNGPGRPAAGLSGQGGEGGPGGQGGPGGAAEAYDQLALIFMCCHPALDPAVRVPLTLRSVCGLSTGQIAAAFLISEPAMAQRLVRAKRKIRQAGIPMRLPAGPDLPGRLAAVLRVVCLVFTEGHMATGGRELVRVSLCDQAIALARALAALLPDEPEAQGLLALLLLTDARRPARTDDAGDLILLADQDRRRWDRSKIAEGLDLVERVLRLRRPGPYQLQAAIAACHSGASSAASTDWPQIVALYEELLRLEPTPVNAANRAAAVALLAGPQAGLDLLEQLAADPGLERWPQLQVALAELRSRLGRPAEARAAYQAALQLGVPGVQRAFIERRLRELSAGPQFVASDSS